MSVCVTGGAGLGGRSRMGCVGGKGCVVGGVLLEGARAWSSECADQAEEALNGEVILP